MEHSWPRGEASSARLQTVLQAMVMRRFTRRYRRVDTRAALALAAVCSALTATTPAWALDGMGAVGGAMAAAAAGLISLAALWLAVIVLGNIAAIVRWRGGGKVWLVVNIITMALHVAAAAFFVFTAVALSVEFLALLLPLVLVVPQVIVTALPRKRAKAA